MAFRGARNHVLSEALAVSGANTHIGTRPLPSHQQSPVHQLVECPTHRVQADLVQPHQLVIRGEPPADRPVSFSR
jgi:Rieske Fe-S protein